MFYGYSDLKYDDLAQSFPDVFKVSVLTRAQVCKKAQEVDLSESLFTSVLFYLSLVVGR